MAHLTRNPVYQSLVTRLNKFPAGAPSSELLMRILEILFTPEEARMVSQLPLRSFNARRAATVWKSSLTKARKILDNLAQKGLLVDIEFEGVPYYTLPPPMAGFFEFSLMRVRSDMDQKALGELFFQYLNVEEDFVKNLFSFETQLGRVFVNEEALTNQPFLEVLDFDRVSSISRDASVIAAGTCYCRHKMSHVNRACNNSRTNCITLNSAAMSLIKHKIAREISFAESREIFQEAKEAGLVQFGENVKEGVNFICNCCKCCCEGMVAARRFGWLHPVHATAFFPTPISGKCLQCKKCVRLCPVDAISPGQKLEDGITENEGEIKINLDRCLGCGVCVAKCPGGALKLQPRKNRVLTPINTSHRVVLQAIENGTLQNLIFDNQALDSHRAMAAIMGVILRLPPAKQLLATKQMKSEFLGWLLKKYPFFESRLGSPSKKSL